MGGVMAKETINPLENFRITEEQLTRLSWEEYQRHKKELCEQLAEKAISGATLSQRNRWLIAELLTNRSHPEPKRRGGQIDEDNDIRIFKRFCRICAELELKGTKPSKIEALAKGMLNEEEAGFDGLDEATIPKAIKRGINAEIKRQTKQHNYSI
jgi:hypothetical protein